jgi:N-acetylglutamate synthase-like GNAT family acetyltransferase
MAEIQLRRARTDDLEEIRAMLVELGYGELAHDEELAGTLKLVLNDPGRAVWLAERKGNVLGMISLEMRAELRLAGLRLTVEELVVRETARGHGVGTHLLDRAKAEAQRVRAKRVELLTNRGRAAYQRRFYAERGFIEVSSAVMRWSPTPST